MLPLSPLLQIPMPDDGQSAWLWVSFLFAVGGAWSARELLKAKDQQIADKAKDAEEWKAAARTAVAEMAANTTALGLNTNAVASVATAIERIDARVSTNTERMNRLEAARPEQAPPRGP